MSNTQTIQPAAVAAEQAIQALHIPVALIDRDPAQPRTHFDEAALADLAESIRAHGVIQPVEVEATGDGRYRLHHGERRWVRSRRRGGSGRCGRCSTRRQSCARRWRRRWRGDEGRLRWGGGCYNRHVPK